MSKIKAGEYIKPFDEIEKVTSIDDDYFVRTDKCNIYYPSVIEITKHSFNIIDLIEVGDYVNGEKVKAIGYPFKESVKEVIFEDDGHTPKIATIVTKEQFAESEYKVC